MDKMVGFAKCLSDETRVRILRLLAERELCVCEMVEVLKAPQARISQHLMRLRGEGLVESSREGQWVLYSLNKKMMRKRMKAMKRFFFADTAKTGVMSEELERLAGLESRSFICERHENAPEEAAGGQAVRNIR